MHIGEICTRSVVTCKRDASALELAQLMRERHVGAVVVVDEHEGRATPVGLVTDRDLVVEVMACGVEPAMLRAADLIVADPVTAVDTELVFDAIWHMRRKGIRRLPVVDAQGYLIGMLTTDDVTHFLAEQLTGVSTIVPGQLKREEATRSASLLGR
jgi:signal-transduction protein with cAMP-binding, CBS, and nucleotidyltransferase domain